MNKTELAAAVSAKTGWVAKDSLVAVNAVFEAIQEELVKGESVQVTGFGTFAVKNRAARTGVNPQNGKKIKIAASKAPVFKTGKTLKEAVNAKPAKKTTKKTSRKK